MSQLISQKNYKKMPWKNKQGTTLEIKVSPENTSLDKMDFTYRLSSAPIVADTTFSQFPGYERLLLTIRGEGFILNDNTYELFEVAHFSGDEVTQCLLLNKEITDLGLVFDPKKVSAQARTMHLSGQFQFSGSPKVEYLIYIQNGNVTLNSVTAKRGDTFYVEPECDLRFETKGRASIVVFKITNL